MIDSNWPIQRLLLQPLLRHSRDSLIARLAASRDFTPASIQRTEIEARFCHHADKARNDNGRYERRFLFFISSSATSTINLLNFSSIFLISGYFRYHIQMLAADYCA